MNVRKGRVVGLVSGGLDSPVAAYLMIERGYDLVAVFFNGKPVENTQQIETIHRIAGILAQYTTDHRIKLIIVPYAKAMESLAARATRKLICLHCKRFMIRVATLLAAQEDAQAIVTGDILGEQASQTADNLVVVSQASQYPILRPLIGMDKTEVMALARKIGTYNESAKNTVCCSFVPKCPSIDCQPAQINLDEAEIPIDELVKECTSAVITSWVEAE